MTLGSSGSGAVDEIVTVDRLIRHISTVPAAAGQELQLFVREKAPAAIVRATGGRAAEGRVVLMIHGGFWPCAPPFDLDHPGYSWMASLAAHGFDVFAMDMTGYGWSSRPMMGDPRNVGPDGQDRLIPATLSARQDPSYPFMLANNDSEAADIDCVVDFIRELRRVERISLIGWSGGGVRSGTYTLRHADKIDRLVILASSNYDREGPDGPPGEFPLPGYPVNFQTWTVGFDERWAPFVRCEGQVAPGIREVVLRQSAATDAVGAGWGPGGLRAPTRAYWGWNARSVASITQPTLVMVGEFDRLLSSNTALYEDLGAERKAFLKIDCASHFAVWEMQRSVLHQASLHWLRDGTLAGQSRGRFVAAADGTIAMA